MLRTYEDASRQQLNLDKTKLLINKNVSEEEVDAIKIVWNVHSVQQHDWYLGLPSFVGRAQSLTFRIIRKEFEISCKVGKKSFYHRLVGKS